MRSSTDCRGGVRSRRCRTSIDVGTDLKSYSVRPVDERDAAVVARHRVAMFREMGEVPTDALATELLSTSTEALAALLREGDYVGWLAIDGNDVVIAGAGVHIKPQLPRISPDGVRVAAAPVPLVVNVYTEPAWRRQGIARALMRTLIEWATAQGCDRVLLHASDVGRPLYLSLGFLPTNEMRWVPAGAGRSRSTEE
jgi:GNAT superfamily N-acetyltransferase